MKVGVVCETSSADRNTDILAALEGRGHEIINAGMTEKGKKPELSYIHAGFLAAMLLNLKKADFVVGGCSTGQGFLIAAMQYPGVFCGQVRDPLDAWLFTQINGGNCISLVLNLSYGWAADVNLRFIFDRIFSVESGGGYPAFRREAQKEGRMILERASEAVHPSFAEVITRTPEEVIRPVLEFPGISQIIDVDTIEDPEVKKAMQSRL
jgi:ribose 5-phosphate isomerase RpiB